MAAFHYDSYNAKSPVHNISKANCGQNELTILKIWLIFHMNYWKRNKVFDVEGLN